jgi:hypothetical protein
MDQNSNYITVEMTFRLQMLCRAPHTICYGKRWIMWTVFILRLIPALWHAIAPHNNGSGVSKPRPLPTSSSSQQQPSASFRG